MGLLNEAASFFRVSRRHFHDVGAVLPSSRFLGRALASNLGQRTHPCRILEAGPGTGPVTKQILPYLLSGDQLDLVELNSEFVGHLQHRLETEPAFTPHQKQVRILCMPIERVEGVGVYDYIVSGLPLNNFSPELVREILRAFKRLLKPGGTLSYFEYAYIRQLKTPFCRRSERRRLSQVGRIVGNYIRRFQVRQQQVPFNVPPALVHHLRFQQS
ncbi:MAG TPA: methyltransferase [Gemmataceae bacterium]|jgi:phospholipid N-methyltransferase|nr:methyltransferase [Gemmataceae bacterium]